MKEVRITGITIDRKEFSGDWTTVRVSLSPEITVSIDVRSEMMHTTGSAHLLEEERQALQALIASIEARLIAGL